jgi:hypothetical protein
MRIWIPVLGGLLAGCAAGQLDDGKPTGESTITIDSVEDLEEVCAENEPVAVTLLVEFPAIEANCPFGEGDNLDIEQGVITARVEQFAELALPEGVVVCGLEFDFLGISGGEGTPMVYDDNFWFTFDDVVLAGSYGPMVEQFELDGSLPIYDWDNVVGTEFEFDDSVPTFCLGEDDGQSVCEIPAPETNGIMSLQFDDDLVNVLSLRAVQAERYEFSFITMGDNDPDDDCAHEYFGFSVEVPYVRL